MKWNMKATIILLAIFTSICIAGCNKIEESNIKAEQDEAEVFSTEWNQIEGSCTTTYEVLGANMDQSVTYDYLY